MPTIAYKLFTVRRNRSIGSLFINRQAVLPVGEWLTAACYPTKGFAVRTGWHATPAPIAPHLGTTGRAWFRVELDEITAIDRPECQGGQWFLAGRMRILGPISNLDKQISLL